MVIYEILEEFEQMFDNMRVYKETDKVLGFEVEYDNERELQEAFDFVETLNNMNIFAEVHEVEPGLADFYIAQG